MDPADQALWHPFWRLMVALGIGLMIGLERGWEQRGEAEGSRIAGFRTFTLIGLFGGLVALLSEPGDDWPLAFGLVALVPFLALGLRDHLAKGGTRSITTLVAALIVYGLGALAARGEMTVAAAVGVIVALLLGFKAELHGMVARLERAELLAVLKLLVMSLVLLPLLPDAGYGPWHALNPDRLWWMVVLITALSSAGYFAIKLLGPSLGLLATALLGGLVSSTAITVALSRRARAAGGAPGHYAGAALVAGAIVAPRVALLASVVAPTLLPLLAWPLLGLGVGCLGMALLLWRGRGDAGAAQAVPLGNPFELGPALKMGAILAAVMLLSEALPRWLGQGGLFALAAVAGLTDVDAITLSYGTQVTDGRLAATLAVWGILVAVAVNALVKGLLGLGLGGRRVGWRLLAGHAVSVALAAAGMVVAAA